ncbi:MAG: phage tail sheath family protein [Lachnospiraceae bacterium]
MAYNHGVRILENPTSLVAPVTGTAGLQVIFGTAPVNMALDPYGATNKPILTYSFSEASAAVGYTDNFKDYTLCQSIDVSFRALNVAPIVLVNVLDPARHKSNVAAETYEIEDSQATVTVFGLLMDKLEVKSGSTSLQADVDYVASFDTDGYVVITILDSGNAAGASSLSVSGVRIDPSLVTANDIIGGYDVATGKESGLELIRQVYPLLGLTPGLIVVPGWSKEPEVAAVVAAKCLNINGSFTCEAVVDLDCSAAGATKYSDVKAVKERIGLVSSHLAVTWPKVKIGSKVYYYSAVFAALIAYTDANNDDVPNLSASNKTLPITALCLDDDAGTEIVLDQEQANAVNSFGVVTAINQNGFRSWGNNSAAYPGTTDPKDRWFCCRRFFSWWGNSFILTYFQRVDDPANFRLIEAICDAENIRGNSYVAQGKCAGCKIVYHADENPITDILNGKVQFKQYLAPYTPAEDILNVLEFSPAMLEAALGGE